MWLDFFLCETRFRISNFLFLIMWSYKITRRLNYIFLAAGEKDNATFVWIFYHLF